MTTYGEVAIALVDAGYLTDADIDAAVTALQDALVVSSAVDVKEGALADEIIQENLIEEAEEWVDEDRALGDDVSEVQDLETLAEVEYQFDLDEATIADAEDSIAGAYSNAAVALVAAGLIDESNTSAVAVVIADVWSD